MVGIPFKDAARSVVKATIGVVNVVAGSPYGKMGPDPSEQIGVNVLASTGIVSNAAINAITNKNSKFGEMNEDDLPPPTLGAQIISILCAIFAVYLVFKCYKKLGKVAIADILAALLCTPCYIAYRLITPC